MTRDRQLVAAFVVFAIGAAALRGALETPGDSLGDFRASSTSAQPGGARALYLWMRSLGYPTTSWREPLTGLGPDVAAFVLLAPTQELTPAQADALFAWVEQGGRLLLAPGTDVELERHLEPLVTLVDEPARAADVPGDRIVPDEGTRWRYRRAGPDEGGAFRYPVEEIAVEGPARVRDEGGQQSILFDRDGAGIAAEIFLGDGVVLLFPEVSLLTNRGLAKADNVDLVASLLEDWIQPGTPIAFDEYDHGERVAGSLLAYLARRRPGLFAVAFLVAGAFLARRVGRALVPRAEPAVARRRRPGEFVEALGGLYARAGAVEPAWAALAETARRLERGTGSVAARAARNRPDGEDRERRLAELATLRAGDGFPPDERRLRRLGLAVAAAAGPPSSASLPSLPSSRTGRTGEDPA